MQDEPHPDSSSDSGDTAEAPQPVPAKNGFAAELLDELNRRTGNYGRYEHEVMIDKGGQGEVWRVRDADLDRRLAMKVLPRLVGQEGVESLSPSALRKLNLFLEEARVTGRLDHPGIVPVHELGLSPQGWVYFTMKLVKGKDLQKILKYVREGSEEWTLARVAGVLVRVCDAVAYAHSKQVVHRDLKPANIMVGRYGEVYVMDWGLARVMTEASGGSDDPEEGDSSSISVIESHWREQAVGDPGEPGLTRDGDAVGTPYYMPPEQALGELHLVDERADVYALGAVLYHLLAGRPPYSRPGKPTQPAMVLFQVQQGPPRRLEEIAPGAPPELVAVCEKAMARSLEHRYRDVSRLGEELRAYLEGRVVGAYETGVVAELKKWYLRNQVWASVAAALVLLIFAGTVMGLILLSQHAQRAELEATKYEQLADGKLIGEQLQRAGELGAPYAAEGWSRYEAWIERTNELLGRRANHQAEYDALSRESSAGTLSEADAWRRGELESLLSSLEQLEQTRRLLDNHLALGRRIEELTTRRTRAAVAWEAAIDGIRSHGEYGVPLEPQTGLLPVGPDPETGLWEFVVFQTAGETFRREWESGSLELESLRPRERGGVLRPQDVDGAMVLVLIPGGSFVMGAQKHDPALLHYDPEVGPDEWPRYEGQPLSPQEVRLEPFLLSKYEMTREQWQRATDQAPSHFPPPGRADDPADSRYAVESVSWRECASALGRLGLSLPTEAQWEYAARAGSAHPWWPGAEVRDLNGFCNLADDYHGRQNEYWDNYESELDDGYDHHAPVGSFGPNDFGLYEVIGNVSEWCRDRYGLYGAVPAVHGDGLRCLLYTSPSPRDLSTSRMPSSA